MERIFLDLSCTDGSDRSIGDAFPSSKLLAVDSCQDCTPKEISYLVELSHVEVNKDVVDGAVVETREPLLISGFDGLSKPSYPVLGEGL